MNFAPEKKAGISLNEHIYIYGTAIIMSLRFQQIYQVQYGYFETRNLIFWPLPKDIPTPFYPDIFLKQHVLPKIILF